MINSKEIKIRVEFLKHSLKSLFPSYWWIVGLLLASLFYFLSVWSYKTEGNILATVKSVSSSHGYGNSSYRINAEYQANEIKKSVVIDLPPGISLNEGEEFIINKHYRYLLPSNYSFGSKKVPSP